MASAMSLAGLVLLTASNVTSSEERPQRVAAAEILSRMYAGYARYRSFSEDVYMNMEEIVTLSVKHNVSDLHLCNAGLRDGANKDAWRTRLLPRLMSTGFCLIGLMMRNNISGERTASLISPSRCLARGACAPVRSHINRERRWRYGYCPSAVLIWRKSRRRR